MKIEIEKEEDGRWIAKVEALALRVIADRIDHGETIPELDELFAVPA